MDNLYIYSRVEYAEDDNEGVTLAALTGVLVKYGASGVSMGGTTMFTSKIP